MSFIDDLRQARSATRTVLFQLLLSYRAKGGTLHAFFEGQDEESYFTSFLRFYTPADYALLAHRCRGKAGVMAAFGAVDRTKYDMRRLLFFVDRDYADILKEVWAVDSHIYTTDHYAIENHVAEPEVLRRYMRDILHLDDTTTEDLLISKYEVQRKRFYAYLLPICAWIVYVMRQSLRPNLSDIKLGDLFQVSDELEIGRVKKSPKGLLAYLDAKTGVRTPPGAWRHIKLVIAELSQRWPAKSWLRGKYELWFFVEFATRIPDLLNRNDLRGTRRVIVRTHMNHSNAMEVLAPRAMIPESLKAFLDHHIARLPH